MWVALLETVALAVFVDCKEPHALGVYVSKYVTVFKDELDTRGLVLELTDGDDDGISSDTRNLAPGPIFEPSLLNVIRISSKIYNVGGKTEPE